MQAKVHDLTKYIVLTYTYPILRKLKATFVFPSLHDKLFLKEILMEKATNTGHVAQDKT